MDKIKEIRESLNLLTRVIHHADSEIARLTRDRDAAKVAIGLLEHLVCGYCGGSGNVMKHIPGCECDGPRQHTCDACQGTGKP